MIFSKSACPFCHKVSTLSEGSRYILNGILDFILENGHELQQAMAAKAGRATVPQVFIRGQHVGGCDDTFAAHCSGKLQEMLFEEKFDYDLIVIGGGSGGLAASKVYFHFVLINELSISIYLGWPITFILQYEIILMKIYLQIKQRVPLSIKHALF
ncbi:unnamed protein product [Larinioides sclopetarius]|uniref:Glutaredoxin domain-containing protein n=1 Tax=Larinioides sclopetarius TaxID=280406 RepID=A0AAV1ZZK0_9ARAC